MKNLQPSPSVFVPYQTVHRLQVHLLLGLGFARAKPIIATEKEEEITDILYQHIQAVLIDESQRWMAMYAVKNEDPISGGSRRGHSRREIDLVIELTGFRRPQHVIEAKPLNSVKAYQRVRNYVDENGMGRFVEGDYAVYTANFPEVIMLGYVLSDSIAIWKSLLMNEIVNKTVDLRLKSTQQDVTICSDFPHEWISEHTRNSSSLPVAIYHILLDCCSTMVNTLEEANSTV